MQKAIPNLLLIVLTFVIICRAELDSEFLQDFCFSNDNWSGVDNQKLLQIIYKSKSPGTDQPYPSSHTSTTRERSTGRPNPGELDDIGSTPIEPTFSCPVSSQPVPVISNTPVNSAAAISTPTYLDHHLKNDHPGHHGHTGVQVVRNRGAAAGCPRPPFENPHIRPVSINPILILHLGNFDHYRRIAHMGSISTMTDALDGHDEEQIALMEERLILLDQDDNAIGEESKKTCKSSIISSNHQKMILTRDGLPSPHQKRAAEKITFPSLWTNTCCSHPLAKEDEMDLKENIGVRRAAQRKLNHELGIQPAQIPLSDFVYLTRIHYLAPSDGLWGEHEIDYILFLTAEVDLNVNPNECSDVTWVSPTELKSMIADSSNHFTPWFELIVNRFLFPWWKDLLDRSQDRPINAHLIADAQDDTIHRMSP
ncbi:hypothetical protein PCASD_22298 [Puccinia coronata f. sp. avenae]|uniref:isopentenyl-diphosphate Delta-isomerase n=1 Tax=Puccinia coronata f. sp. avenae TaxID=200324 RepID=A0A2N5S6M8_9BASI|nr:hypothetical protein PCASD_22298 [Puccinia coronata f. sp. avenae]